MRIMCGIYMIRNLMNGKIYIGSSNNLRKRKWTHFRDLAKGTHSNPHLLSAWRTYGAASFEFYILEECPEAQLVQREDHYIALHKSIDRQYGYNSMSACRHILSEETRKKISAFHKGRPKGPFSAEHKKHISESAKKRVMPSGPLHPMWGKHHTPDAINKIRQSHVAIWDRFPHPMKGKARSEETRRKISEANKGKARPNISIALKGIPWSPEQRAAHARSRKVA